LNANKYFGFAVLPIERLFQDHQVLSFVVTVACCSCSACLVQQIRNLTWNLCASKPLEIRDQRRTNARITSRSSQPRI